MRIRFDSLTEHVPSALLSKADARTFGSKCSRTGESASSTDSGKAIRQAGGSWCGGCVPCLRRRFLHHGRRVARRRRAHSAVTLWVKSGHQTARLESSLRGKNDIKWEVKPPRLIRTIGTTTHRGRTAGTATPLDGPPNTTSRSRAHAASALAISCSRTARASRSTSRGSSA
jgi:hypothetical protein